MSKMERKDRRVTQDKPRGVTAVVLDGTELSVLFFDEEEGGGIWTFGGADVSLLQMLLNEFL